VVGVPEGFSTYETWPFECLHCLRVWEEDYLVRRQTDGHGNDVAIWTREGTQVQPPWSGTVCPHCGCGSVTTFPTGYLSHHTEAHHTEAPEAPLTRRPAPAPAPAETARRRPRHIPPILPYALVAISLLVLTGMQVYGGVQGH
jgi:hypothetical protein